MSPVRFPDVFSQAKAAYTIYDLWPLLRLPGEPKPTCKSPFRQDRHASFSIFDGGRAFKDHGGEGAGGDVIEFDRLATGWSHAEIREFFLERLGIDHHDPPSASRKTPGPHKEIQWPCELQIGTEATWRTFSELKGLERDSVWVMVQLGFLRFGTVNGHRCYVILDDHQRAAEIRRVDGKAFSSGSKTYPLKGVDKSWLPGASLIAERPATGWAICEGASDFLHLVDLYVRYRRAGGTRQTVPLTMLGASVKRIDPRITGAARGRTILLIPDADEAGDRMKHHWVEIFTSAGAAVEVFNLPRGKDLRDVAEEIQPGALFNE